ncbi:MAG: cation transporting ATPase [Monoraphidium minutum]|nr:MAG: cation transporting ATPase [Monoraphidium minutum]
MGLFSRKKAEPAVMDKTDVMALARGPSEANLQELVIAEHEDIDLPWHSVASPEDVLEDLLTTTEGLSAAEAARRLKDYGPNQLRPPQKVTFLERLWAQLNNIVIFILFVAAVIEGALQSWAEFALVLIVIVFNAALGLIQEGKAEKAADAIKAMLSPTAKVKRGGEPQVIPAEELVPGDIVLLKSGDKVPADVRLVTATNLQVQEAMLTGESVPVSKNASKAVPEKAPLGDRKNMAYSATSVVSGTAEGVVVGTGDCAEIGQISRLVNTVETVNNNLTRQLDVFGRWLAVLVLLVVVASFLLAKFRANESWRGAFESAVSIAVAVIPEGLPAVVTVVLAIGTTVMARNNAIVRQLPAVETLGSVNVICSDKTGTLTKNEMTVVRIRTVSTLYHVGGVGYAPEGEITVADAAGEPGTALGDAAAAALRGIVEGGVLANDSALTKGTDEATGKVVYSPTGAPTEVALLTAGQKAGIDMAALKAAKPRVSVIPFESEHKFMASVNQDGDKNILFVKGASDRLLPICKSQFTSDDLSKSAPIDVAFWNDAQSELSSQGLRVLALCRAELPKGEPLDGLTAAGLQKRAPFLTMVAVFAILDPPRVEVVAAIKEAHRAGITVKMITGDHRDTALAIGKMLGIAGEQGLALTGPEVDAMADEELRRIAPDCNIYARASPQNKIRIVRALQDAEPRKVVSMTGDGVNDAPALKAADVGVAMGITGTDVSKEAAKMVLADDNFASIVAAVKEGRRVWDNIVRLLLFNMPVTIAQGISVMWAYILGLAHAPLTVLQILLVNMVTAMTLGMSLAAEPAEPDVMDRPPRPANKRLVGKLVLWRMVFVSHLIVAAVLGAFYWGEKQGYSLPQRRSEAFNVLVAAQIGYFITCRFLKATTLHYRVLFGNWVAYVSILLTIGIQMFFTYVPVVNSFFGMGPINGLQWGRVVVMAVIIYLIVEFEKAIIDPVVVPLVKPVTNWVNAHAPAWLKVDFSVSRTAGRLCKLPRTQTPVPQRAGTLRKSTSIRIAPPAPPAAAGDLANA